MTNYFLIYDSCCFYEIVLLSYFLNNSANGPQKTAYCSACPDAIRTEEGFLVQPDLQLASIAADEAASFIIPGGDITHALCDDLEVLLHSLKNRGTYIGALCAGVDILNTYGILDGISLCSVPDTDVKRSEHIITASPNANVDFAVEIGRTLGVSYG